MTIFVDPSTGQIKAFYTEDTTSTVWTRMGYRKGTINDPKLQRIARRLELSGFATISGNTVDRVLETRR